MQVITNEEYEEYKALKEKLTDNQIKEYKKNYKKMMSQNYKEWSILITGMTILIVGTYQLFKHWHQINDFFQF